MSKKIREQIELLGLGVVILAALGCTQAEFSTAKVDALSKSNVFGDGGSLGGIGGDGTSGGGRGGDGTGGGWPRGGDGSGGGSLGSDPTGNTIRTENICSYRASRTNNYKTVASSAAVSLRVIDTMSGQTVCTLTDGLKEAISKNKTVNLSSCNLNGLKYDLRLSPSGEPNVDLLLPQTVSPGTVRMLRGSTSTPWVFGDRERKSTVRVLMDNNPNEEGSNVYGQQINPDCTREASPLVINLTPEGARDRGLRLTSPERGILFDILGENAKPTAHTAVQISWPRNRNYMFLALPNERGEVRGINELFGDNTKGPDGRFADHGYAALAKHDANGDGFIDREDGVFESLRLWSDRNFNGRSEVSELFRLTDFQLERIDLDFDAGFSETDRYGNRSALKSVVNASDGRVHVIFDLWFVLK